MSDVATTGARQGRSPAYPYVSLRKALSRAKALYIEEGKHAVPPSSAYKAWGIGAKSSSARQTLAALKQFGLVTYSGKGAERQVRVSDFAMKIILDKRADSPMRDDLIRRAALIPLIYMELWQKYGADLPSDATIETYLLLDREFNESAVSGLIADFKDTLELAKLSEPDKMPDEDAENGEPDPDVSRAREVLAATEEPDESEDDEDGDSQEQHTRTHRLHRAKRKEQPGMKEDVFTLKEGLAVIQWPAQLSEESYEDFEAWMNLVLRKAARSVPTRPLREEERAILGAFGYSDDDINEFSPWQARDILDRNVKKSN